MNLAFPNRWNKYRLGDVLPLSYGKGLPQRARVEGAYPVLGSNGVVGTHSDALTERPALVVGRKGAAGAVYFARTPAWVIDTAYYTQGTDATDLSFGYHLLTWLRLGSLDRSTAIPSLGRDDYSSVQVGLPGLPEQLKIAAKIDELFSDLDAGVAALERAKANLGRYRAAVLKAAVEGKLTEQWRHEHPDVEPASELLERILEDRRRRWEEEQTASYAAKGKRPPRSRSERYTSPARAGTEVLPALPPRWCWVTIDEVAEVGTGATPKRGDTRYWSGGTIPWVRSATVNGSFVREASEFVTQTALQQTNLTLYPAGTLLVAMYGEGRTRGKVTELAIDATTNQALAALQLKGTARSLKPYLRLYLESVYEELRRRSAGGVQPNLNLGLIRTTIVPLPPESEQSLLCRIVEEHITAIDSCVTVIASSQLRSAALRRAVLNRAFSGQLASDGTP